MILFSHPTMSLAAWHAARALNGAGVLAEFWSCGGSEARPTPRQGSPGTLQQTAEPPGHAHDGPAIMAAAASGVAGKAAGDPAAARALDLEMEARVQRCDFNGVYAYEGAAEATFRAAASRGLRRIYDLPCGHWRPRHAILAEEAECNPAWSECLALAGPVPDAARSRAEFEQADLVIVPSTFALLTLEPTTDVTAAFAVAVPGPPAVPPPNGPRAPLARDRPLRVLYVGPLTQRTGLSYAFAACRALGSSVTLTLVSPATERIPRVLAAELARCHWISDTSAAVVQQAMDSHDVFLYPALYDAGTPVLQHALASGLPIIATPNSAAPDLVSDGVDGFIVPIRSSDDLAARLELLRQQPERRLEMARAARRRSLVTSWGRFENTVAATVAATLGRRA